MLPIFLIHVKAILEMPFGNKTNPTVLIRLYRHSEKNYMYTKMKPTSYTRAIMSFP